MRASSNSIRVCALTALGMVSALPGWPDNQVLIQTEKGEKYNLEPSAEYAFSGITTFRQLPSSSCLLEQGAVDDVLIVGLPFDTATSYRSGTRFGPNAIRQGSRAGALT